MKSYCAEKEAIFLQVCRSVACRSIIPEHSREAPAIDCGNFLATATSLEACIGRMGDEWMLVVDLDEYVYAKPRAGFATIPAYLSTLDAGIAAVAVPQLNFASSNLPSHPVSVINTSRVRIADGVKPFSASGGTSFSDYSAYSGFAHLAAGLVCGLSGVAAGIAIGIVGDAGVRAVALQPKVYVGMVLILIFAEALGLYGLIVGLILAARTSSDCGA